ncbi:MAG: putative sulfatase [Paenibacillaceae bacterium]|nr:putative sulfatase [Paenibacillaceae bacterium]
MGERPNLLFILTDEQAYNTMKAYGNDLIETPNMDRLAADSIIFDRVYCTWPVCTPSRGTIMTGLYPHKHGCIGNNVGLSPDIPCLTEIADLPRHRKAYFGKWHLGDEIFKQRGFDEWVSIEDYVYRKYCSPGKDADEHSSYHQFLTANGIEPNQVTEDGYAYFDRHYSARLPEAYSKPKFLADEAIRFIKENKDQPFVLYVNFLEPHMPYTGPRDNQYDRSVIPFPPNFRHRVDDRHPSSERARKYLEQGFQGAKLSTDDDWREMIARYWGLVSLVDTHLGRILDTLKDCGLYDDTITVFTSDHGDMMGSHGLLEKGAMFEEAIRVPLLLRGPGLPSGVRVGAQFSQIDLVPTLLEMLGVPRAEHLQGQSWLAGLHNMEPYPERDIFVELHKPDQGWTRAVLTPDRWKYIDRATGPNELYQLQDDPYEMNNLAEFPSAEKTLIIQELCKKIEQWQKS